MTLMDITQADMQRHEGDAGDRSGVDELLEDLETLDPALAPEPAEQLAESLTSLLDATSDVGAPGSGTSEGSSS